MPKSASAQRTEAWNARDSKELEGLLAIHGRKWKTIGNLLGRTPSAVRNRVKRLEGTLPLRKGHKGGKPRCSRCGKLRRAHICELDGSLGLPDLANTTDMLLLYEDPNQSMKRCMQATATPSPCTVTIDTLDALLSDVKNDAPVEDPINLLVNYF